MRPLSKKKTQWKEDLYFAVKFAWQKLSKYYTTVTPTTGMLLISAHILDPFGKLQSFRMWDKGMDINPEDETSYSTQYQEAFLKYVENEYCAKHRHLIVTKPESILNNNLVSSAMASRSGQTSYDPYDSSSNDGEYLMPNNVAKMTPGWSNCAARPLTAARLYLNSPPELTQNGGKLIRILMITTLTKWTLVVHVGYRISPTGCGSKKKCTESNLPNVARDEFSTIHHGVGVEARFSHRRDVFRWRQPNTTGESVPEKVVVRQFARANSGLLAGDDPVLDPTSTDNNMEMNREAEQQTLHWMAKVLDVLEMWQGNQYLWATQKESWTQNTQMSAIGYISDTEEILKASWSNFQHDGAAAYKLSEKSPVPPALSTKDLPGGRTQVLNVCQIKRTDRHAYEVYKSIGFMVIGCKLEVNWRLCEYRFLCSYGWPLSGYGSTHSLLTSHIGF